MAEASIRLRPLLLAVYLPVAVYEIGNGAIGPVVALTGLRLGAPLSVAGTLPALLGIGQILGNVPAGLLATRLGERRCMIIAALTSLAAMITCARVDSLMIFAVAVLMIGVANSAYYLARQSYLTTMTPPAWRARAMSMLSGAHRVGLLIGPFAGAAAISVAGLRASYLVAAGAVSTAVVLLIIGSRRRDSGSTGSPIEPVRRSTGGRPTWWQAVWVRRHLFATLGVTVLILRAVQSTRGTLLPLWAHRVGVPADTLSLIFGIGGAVEVALVYPAGRLMDRRGRLSVALPSVLLLAAGVLLLPWTNGVGGVAASAVIIAVGQGLGAGLIFTLAADAATGGDRTAFLSGWRLFSDTGTAVGPVGVSLIGAVTWPAAALATGALALLAAFGLARWVPRYSDFASPRAIRRQQGATTPPP